MLLGPRSIILWIKLQHSCRSRTPNPALDSLPDFTLDSALDSTLDPTLDYTPDSTLDSTPDPFPPKRWSARDPALHPL